MTITKKIFVIAAGAVVLWGGMNFEYFRKQVEYRLRKSEVIEATVPETMTPDRLVVFPLSIDAPVLYADRVDENYFQELLQSGVVHYPGTALPGEMGNVYIFGHSSDNAWSKGKYKTVFALLPRMTAGEKIFLSDSTGHKYVYKVIETRVVSNNDLSVLSQDTGGRKFLTLQTSYPVGTSLKRYVIIAELME